MEKIQFAAEIPVARQEEVLVLGAGPAGLCAAVAAARNGAKTLLIEQSGFAGGMATAGLVNPFMTSYSKSSDVMVIRGLFEEIIRRLEEKDGAIHPEKIKAPSPYTSWITIGHDHVAPFDAEKFKLVADEMLKDAGVNVLYHTSFVNGIVNKDRVQALVVNSKNGLQSIKAALFIDCSGDGDLAANCGAAFETGDEKNRLSQPATLFFRIGNVDSQKLEEDVAANMHTFRRENGINYRSFHWRVSDARSAGDWNLDRTSIGIFKGVAPGEWNINTSRIMGVDGTSAESLSAAEMEGRRQVDQIFSFIRKYLPGCENAVLLASASTVGVRETRHIRGKYLISAEDLLNCVIPEDVVLLASNSIDVHGRFGPLSNDYKPINGEWYGLPYRSLIPLGFKNLLVAGRCISATSEAAGAVRLMPVCMGTGQAAGTAAALIIKNKEPDFSLLDIKELQKTLKNQNVFLP